MGKSVESSKPEVAGAGYIPPQGCVSMGLVLPRAYQNTQRLCLLEEWCHGPHTDHVFGGPG